MGNGEWLREILLAMNKLGEQGELLKRVNKRLRKREIKSEKR